ncbi:MAG: SoxR reducing system RseC family protein [Coriobacteriia bacterium]|jgi:positive regulator of sigma E activity|nr:SoxR reducing system RseC family protein [Coriobacteriia bacterium]
MLERGIVVAVRAGSVDVAIEPSEACETCGGCAEGAAGKRLLQGVVDTCGARRGDEVEVETSGQARRRAQGLVYVVPVVAIVGGYVAGFLLGTLLEFAPDALGAVVGIGASIVALISVTRLDRRFEIDGGMPRVRAIIARCHSGDARHGGIC